MLRSKNLKKILEQALTKDICICAVFNEDGVVLAHAATTDSFNNRTAKEATHCSAPTTAAATSAPSDIGRPNTMYNSQIESEFLRNEPTGTQFLANDQQYNYHSQRPQYSTSKQGVGSETVQKRQTGVSTIVAGTTTSLLTEYNAHASSASGTSRKHEDSQSTTSGSYISSFSDDVIGSSPKLSIREKLEDDLAIAANLWQSYESVSSLIERKDRDIDENVDVSSEMHDDMLGNSLNMIMIECEYGKAVVTRIGSYRLFLLSKPLTPLGLLRLKSDNLSRYLEECLHCAPA
ncbi:hypothetical protein GGI25_005041 [Coemansia spiralis]|uniref:Roadblock/LAMTOR2 domain-containing protein n=2 Tax=Coemansia TaxID=4863 RepID=A0A9W8G3Y3_9FUNG|nr:hypothetical protein BX070DRAFT_218392 [Coemansia spiralis]KAJ1989107.1 hypothetical protein EDC05_004903 [Coemansia umbellata]KAJ2620215.1 hypothetical protein GGI26_005172 [Coemansia sp. RSA 1358]KAJ2672543.1 hypothetical protein GGI25_005041 [Coemansia spiralis]